MGKLSEFFRGLQRINGVLGSAAAPPPIELPKPEDMPDAEER
ncbi:MAG TPA: hypothetical protein VFE15_13170 [Marmoricola sp.]|jgi:hypothetical protein|nr:hypothetical protein [Marmoricola sp.]